MPDPPPGDLAGSYAGFLAARREVTGTWGGHRWTAWVGGSGPRTLLLLPGSTRVPHTYFQLVASLEPRMRVVAVAYPPARTMAELVDGLLGLLDHLGVARADLFGSSFGGFVALAFARRAPDRVGRVALANTAPPTRSLARRYLWARRLLRPLPAPLLRRATAALWSRGLAAAPGSEGFWRARLAECLGLLTAADLRAQFDELADYACHPLAPADLAGVRGPWLVVESGHDAAIPPRAQAALRTLLPQARVVRLADAGHTALFTHPRDYLAAVAGFLSASSDAA